MLTSPVNQIRLPRPIHFNAREQSVIDSEINSMIVQGIIAPTSNAHEPGEFISNIFFRPKKDGGIRVILNLRNFNEYVQPSHFKMNSLQSAIDLMRPRAYMASVDFKSAYYSVAIRPLYRKYLRFIYRDQKYEFCCLPNGLSTGPRDFTQLVKTLFKILQQKGHMNTFYLDDSFLTHGTFLGCLHNVIDTVEISRAAGFTVHPSKSSLIPAQKLTFLGFVLCTITMTVRLTVERRSKIKTSVRNLLRLPKITIQNVAEVVGQLVATFPAVPHGKLFYRYVDIDKTEALKQAKGDFSAPMVLSQQASADLTWWLNCIDDSVTNIQSRNPDFILTTDASTYGFGGCFQSRTFRGQWNVYEQPLHVNQKELLAVLHCLRNLCRECKNCTIQVMTDNTTTMSYINNMGGKIRPCNNITRQIWNWAILKNIWLISSYIPGKLNTEADQLSRVLNETTEWSLNDEHFDRVLRRYPTLEIDLFASHLNNKLPRYVSWLPDENSSHCDAFCLDWSKFYSYAFPPFCLIGKVLRKVELDGCLMVLIVPEWPSQSWYSKLESMLIEPPMCFPRNGRSLHNPLNQKAAPIRSRFLACNISGLIKKSGNFQRKSLI